MVCVLVHHHHRDHCFGYVCFSGVVTFQSPSVSTSPIAAGDVSPITVSVQPTPIFFPASGVVAGDHLAAFFAEGTKYIGLTN